LKFDTEDEEQQKKKSDNGGNVGKSKFWSEISSKLRIEVEIGIPLAAQIGHSARDRQNGKLERWTGTVVKAADL
jgi:hypothetical protein